MQLHPFTILIPQQYSKRQVTCIITENGLWLLFQKMIENNYFKDFIIIEP